MAPTAVLEPGQETRDETELAPRWKVIVHDDPLTTFEFVIDVMRSVFKKPLAEARRITQETHDTGSALVEVTSFEEAELHCEQVRSLARPRGFPLVLTMEPAD
jgi:ATP-dependent Clp protease adaptor protein ClpS